MAVAIRTSAFALLDAHNPWRDLDQDVDMTIRREPVPVTEPEPVVVSPAWRSVATGEPAPDIPETGEEVETRKAGA